MQAALRGIQDQFGDEMNGTLKEVQKDERSFTEASNDAHRPLTQSSERSHASDMHTVDHSPTEAPVALQMSSASQNNSIPALIHSIDIDTEVRRARNWSLVGAGAGATIYGGLSAAGTLFLGASASMVALSAGISAVGGGIYGGVAALSTYGLGILHNLVWHKEGRTQPGALGTMARGIIAPISIPIGLVARLFRS